MKEGQIISNLFLEKKGKMICLVIRRPSQGDLDNILKFYNKVIKETKFLSRISPVSKKEEREWLKRVLIANRKGKRVDIFAEHNGKIVGNCEVDVSGSEVSRHTGHYGISILQEYTSLGLGTKMTEHVFRLAKKDLKLEMVQLSVYSKNRIAYSMYKKFGFVTAGKIPRGIKHGKQYQDNIIMYKVLK